MNGTFSDEQFGKQFTVQQKEVEAALNVILLEATQKYEFEQQKNMNLERNS